MSIISNKKLICIFNLLLSFICTLPTNVKFLIFLIVIDFISGIIKSCYGNSDKSKTGYISSTAMKKGFMSKIFIFLILAVSYYIDNYVNANGYVFNYTIVYFSIESCFSIIENATMCGVKVPALLAEKLDINKGERND